MLELKSPWHSQIFFLQVQTYKFYQQKPTKHCIKNPSQLNSVNFWVDIPNYEYNSMNLREDALNCPFFFCKMQPSV